jgi:hypothetical protein
MLNDPENTATKNSPLGAAALTAWTSSRENLEMSEEHCIEFPKPFLQVWGMGLEI